MIKILYGATKQINAKVLCRTILLLICSLCFNSALHAGGKETVTYYHHDALGSVVAATNEQGQVIWREEYKPFGARIVKDAASQKHRVWYTGHTEEQALGLVYMGARWYHPEIGQFLSIDPVGFNEENPQSFNRYAYANNNPYKYVDPDGREIVFSSLNQAKHFTNLINQHASKAFTFNKDLQLRESAGGERNNKGSDTYSRELISGIKSSHTIKVTGSDSIESKTTARGDVIVYSKNLDIPTTRGKESSTPAIQLMHELVEHAIPHATGRNGHTDGQPPARDNIIRGELGLGRRIEGH